MFSGGLAMNTVYKVVWSTIRNCCVAESEITRGRGKGCTSLHRGAKAARARAGLAPSAIAGGALFAGIQLALLSGPAALAAPVMPTLDYRGAAPHVTISSSSSNTTAAMAISSTQAGNVLKWIDFSIGKGGSVQFDDKNYLNYVTGHARSEIDGVLKGGGSIYLINPNGILFGSTARVDVGSLHLSTRRLTDAQLAGYGQAQAALFKTDSASVGDVINLGRLNADRIEVEGRNITFKNVADVTKGGTLTNGDITGGTAHHEKADGDVSLTVNTATGNEGEIHLGFAVGVDGTINGSAAASLNASQYANVTVPQEFTQTPSHTFNHWSVNVTPTHYMLVRNGYELQNMRNNLTSTNGTKMPGNYMLANDINLQDGGSSPASFQPIGYKNDSGQEFVFLGKFDGLSHAVKNLNISTSSLSSSNVSSGVGLFGINGGTVENVVVEGTIGVEKPSVGGIVGINRGLIRNVRHAGGVTGNGDVGGIAGHNMSGGTIERASNTGNIAAHGSGSNVGGIAGINEGVIAQAYNTGRIGNNNNNNVGGISGKLSGASAAIEDAYSCSADSTSTDPLIAGSSNVGGIVGLVEGNSTSSYVVRNTYSTGTVPANSDAGGIIGNVVSAGSGTPAVTVESSYFSAGANNGYGVPKSIAALQNGDTFDNWSISAAGGAGTTWRIYQGQTTPLLAAFLKPKDLVKTYVYDGAPHSVAKNDPLLDDEGIRKSDQFGGNWDNYASSLTDAGAVNILKQEMTFLYSLQDGYDLVDMKLIVQPKALTVGNALDKTYDGTNAATLTLDALSGVLDADREKLTVGITSATYSDKNAGENKAVSYAGLTLSGDAAKNYVIKADGSGTGTISPKQVTVAFDPIRKTYDGKTGDVDELGYAVASRPGKLSGVVAVDEGKVSVSGTATYADKNASNSSDSHDKTVYYSGLALGAGTDGDESANYVLASTSMTVENSGRIDKANVTLTAGALTKTYDGTTDATGGTLVAKEGSGTVFDSDSLSGGTFAFEDKNAGTNKTVKVASGSATITDKDTGADTSGNYNITYEDSTAGIITPKVITATFSDISKTYDGTTADTETSRTGTLEGVLALDDGKVNVTASAVYDKKDAGSRTVNYTSVALSGDEANNYSIAATATGVGTIQKKVITAAFADISKTYDGTTDAQPGAATLLGVEALDEGQVTASSSGALYDDKNAGSRLVQYSGVALSGTGASNYSIAATAEGKGVIERKPLELLADSVTIPAGQDRPAAFTGSVTGFVAGEHLGAADTLRFVLTDPSAVRAGSYGITGTLNGSSSGTYGANYTFSNAASNATAFVIAAASAHTVADMTLSDLIPGLMGRAAQGIKITEMDNTFAQASVQQAEGPAGFAFEHGVASIDMGRGGAFENTAPGQLSSMPGEGRAEPVRSQQKAGGDKGAKKDGRKRKAGRK